MRDQIERLTGLVLSIACLLLAFGCGSTHTPPTEMAEQPAVDFSRFPPVPPEAKKVVAICSFENKTRRGSLVLLDEAPGMLRGTLLKTSQFRLIEWEKVQQALEYNDLRLEEIFALSPEAQKSRNKIKEVLLHDYYIWGEVTRLGSREEMRDTAFTSKKTITAEAEVEIFIRDAATTETLHGGRGMGKVAQEFVQQSGVGVIGESEPMLEQQALRQAIEDGVYQLLQSMHR